MRCVDFEPFLYKVVVISVNAVLATKNYAPEIASFGTFAGVSPTVVQWKALSWEDHLHGHSNLYARGLDPNAIKHICDYLKKRIRPRRQPQENILNWK
ncbi:hypothetical protein J6590_075122 [Homalodisca vitripennis]|nr:hypothetical protein J6590_075122 [Homalodisca vitripennis]